jgi:hypothetical protein
VLNNSQITVHPNGHWEWPGFSPAWHAGPGSLVVVPYGVVPVRPTLPTTIAGLVDLLFGSAHATQVTDASGHKLLNADGSINANPKTRIPGATRFATLSGSAKPGADIFLFGNNSAYTQTIAGKSAGEYRSAFLGRGMAASITAATAAGITDKVSMLPNVAGLQFGQAGAAKSGPRSVNAQILVHSGDGSEKTASVGTTMAATGGDSVSFDSARNAAVVKAAGQRATYSLTLSWAGKNGLPQTFVTPKQAILPGETASYTPAHWSSLADSTVVLRVVHKNGKVSTSTIHNTLRATGQSSIALEVGKRTPKGRRLTIDSSFKHLAKGSTALLTWQVFKGKTLAGHHTVSATVKELQVGRAERTYVFKAQKGTQYTLKGNVVLLSPTKGGSFLSQMSEGQKSFQG